MYAVVLTAILHKPYILLTEKFLYISIIHQLKHYLIIIVCLLSTENVKIHLNLITTNNLIITNGDR